MGLLTNEIKNLIEQQKLGYVDLGYTEEEIKKRWKEYYLSK